MPANMALEEEMSRSSSLTASRLQRKGHNIHRGTCEALQQAILAHACRVILALHYLQTNKPTEQSASTSATSAVYSQQQQPAAARTRRGFDVDALSLVQDGILAPPTAAANGEAPSQAMFFSAGEVKACLAGSPRYGLLTAVHLLRCTDSCAHLSCQQVTGQPPLASAVEQLFRNERNKAFRAEAVLLLTEWLLKDRREDDALVRNALDLSSSWCKASGDEQAVCEGDRLAAPAHSCTPIVRSCDALVRVFPELGRTSDSTNATSNNNSNGHPNSSRERPVDITCGCHHRWFSEDLPRWLLHGALWEHAMVWYDVALMGRALRRWCLRRGFRVLGRMAAGEVGKEAILLRNPKSARQQEKTTPLAMKEVEVEEEEEVARSEEDALLREGGPSPPTADRATRGPSVASDPNTASKGSTPRGSDVIHEASSIGSVPSLPSDAQVSLAGGKEEEGEDYEHAPPVEAEHSSNNNNNSDGKNASRLDVALSGVAGTTLLATIPPPPPPPQDEAVVEEGNTALHTFVWERKCRQRRLLFYMWRDGKYYASMASRYMAALARENTKRGCLRAWLTKARQVGQERRDRENDRLCVHFIAERQEEQLSGMLRKWHDVTNARRYLRATLGARVFRQWLSMLALRIFRRRASVVVPTTTHTALQIGDGGDSPKDCVALPQQQAAARQPHTRDSALRECFATWRERYVAHKADHFHQRHLRLAVIRSLRATATQREHERVQDEKARGLECLFLFHRWKRHFHLRRNLATLQKAHGHPQRARSAFAHWKARAQRRWALAAQEQRLHAAHQDRTTRTCFRFWRKRRALAATLRDHATRERQDVLQSSWQRWRDRLASRALLREDQHALADAVFLRELSRRVLRRWHASLCGTNAEKQRSAQEQQLSAATALERQQLSARVFYHWQAKAYVLVAQRVDARRALPAAAITREVEAERDRRVREAKLHRARDASLAAAAVARRDTPGEGKAVEEGDAVNAVYARVRDEPTRATTKDAKEVREGTVVMASAGLPRQQHSKMERFPRSALQAERNFLAHQARRLASTTTAAAAAAATVPARRRQPITPQWEPQHLEQPPAPPTPVTIRDVPSHLDDDDDGTRDDSDKGDSVLPERAGTPPPGQLAREGRGPQQQRGLLRPAGLNVSYETQVKGTGSATSKTPTSPRSAAVGTHGGTAMRKGKKGAAAASPRKWR